MLSPSVNGTRPLPWIQETNTNEISTEDGDHTRWQPSLQGWDLPENEEMLRVNCMLFNKLLGTSEYTLHYINN
jgi:hypothetical protein